ncbi:hypothetical protein TNCV_2308191 [Trichonephila clavipes]|nr:hypothetical protein TNCV_2308191 [Trichonephila clavipes]
MGDNKKHENKATRKIIILETKMQVIRGLDTGERQSQMGAALNLAASTIRTILKNKGNILSSNSFTMKRFGYNQSNSKNSAQKSVITNRDRRHVGQPTTTNRYQTRQEVLQALNDAPN